jgi:hypothetical protein
MRCEQTCDRLPVVADAGLGLLGAATRLYENEGASGLLRGVPATCSKQLPYTATKQASAGQIRLQTHARLHRPLCHTALRARM